MRLVSLREFRTRGVKALASVPDGETVLLSGQQGPAYFLVPVIGDLAAEDRELKRALAKASLMECWAKVAADPNPLTEADIQHEIDEVRRLRRERDAQ